MNDYNKFGYLGSDPAKWLVANKYDQEELYDLGLKINKFLHPLIFELKVHNKMIQEMLTVSLFLRSLSIYQGVMLYIQRGMFQESKYLLRVLLEIKYKIITITKDIEFAKDFIFQDTFARRKRVKDYNNWSDQLKENNKKLDVDKLRSEIEKEIKDNNLEYHPTRWYAEKAELLDDYYTAYVVLSGDMHMSARELESDFIIENGEIVSLKTEPDIVESTPILQTMINSMLKIANSLSNVFDIDISKEINDFNSEFKKICTAECE